MAQKKSQYPEVRGPFFRKSVVTVPQGESMTQQSFKDATDVNNIMAKYIKTGIIDHINVYEPAYGEVDGTTFTEAMQTVANATTMFMDLPSRAREAFDHDPAKFLDYVNNLEDKPEHRQFMYDLGLTDLITPPAPWEESDDLSGRQATKTALQNEDAPAPADSDTPPSG